MERENPLNINCQLWIGQKIIHPGIFTRYRSCINPQTGELQLVLKDIKGKWVSFNPDRTPVWADHSISGQNQADSTASDFLSCNLDDWVTFKPNISIYDTDHPVPDFQGASAATIKKISTQILLSSNAENGSDDIYIHHGLDYQTAGIKTVTIRAFGKNSPYSTDLLRTIFIYPKGNRLTVSLLEPTTGTLRRYRYPLSTSKIYFGLRTLTK